MWETWVQSLGLEDPWRRERLPMPVFWLREFHGLYLWGHKESDMVERLSLSYLCPGEGNGNPPQCSCLENLMDRGPDGLQSMGLQRVGHDFRTKQQYMCPSYSEPPLLHPSPSHPSALSQRTGFGRSASCTELALALYFTYGNVYVSVLFSSIIPPSPLPLSPEVCPLCLCLFCFPACRIISAIFLNSLYVR